MDLNFWFVVLCLGIAQGVFLIIALLLLKNKRKNSIHLLVFLIVCFLSLIIMQLSRFYLTVDQVLELYKFGGGIPLLIGPVFLFFIQSTIDREFKLDKTLTIHFLPFVLALFLLIIPGTQPIITSTAFIILKGLHTLMYYVASLMVLSRAKKDRKHKKRDFNFNLLFRLVLVQIFALILIYAIVGLEGMFASVQIDTDMISSLIFIFFFFGFVLAIIVYPHNLLPNQSIKSQYTNSILSPARKEMIYQDVLKALSEDQVYLDPGLTLASLAARMNVHSNQLSQVINEMSNKNFNQLINEYRVMEVKRNIMDDRKSLLGIAYDSGFNSKSAFNRIFKELEGLTPTQYKKSLKK